MGRTNSIGLWAPLSSRFEDEEEDDDIPVLNFGFDKLAAASPPSESSRDADPYAINGKGVADRSTNGGSGISTARSPRPEPEQLGAGAGGLWGVPRPPDDADRLRDLSGSKRRWTVSERS